MNYDIKKAIRANLIFIWVFTVLLTITAYINGGFEYAIRALIATLSTSLFATMIYFLPINQIVKGEIMIVIPFLASVGLSVINGGVARMFNIYVLALVMQALYFDLKRMIVVGVSISSFLIALYLINPHFLLDVGMGLGDFVPRIGALICIFIVLVLLTKWVSETLKDAQEQGEKSQRAYEQLNLIFESIRINSQALKDKSSYCSDKMNESYESNEMINKAMDELSLSVEEAANTISQISKSVSDSGENVQGTFDIMNSINELFRKLKSDFEVGGAAVGSMHQAIERMRVSTDETFNTTQKLSKQINEIQSYLDGIVSIAEQTNLLALNASIEAARAGEHGKGFSVVADEIRKLSVESNKFAEDIRGITNTLITATSSAIDAAKAGNEAMLQSKEAMNELNGSFTKVNENIELVDKDMKQESVFIKNVHQEFANIEDAISNIAAILEENSAHFQEITSRVALQVELSKLVNNEVEEISEIGQKLYSDTKA